DADYPPVAASHHGAVFDLVDLEGRSVGSVAWLDDYTDTSSEKAQNALEYRVRNRSPILAAGPGNTFALWNVKPDERVEYAVERDAKAARGWSVRETARKPLAAERPKPKPAEPLPLGPLAA